MFIKRHDLKLEDESTFTLAAEFATEMCRNVEAALQIEAPKNEKIGHWVRDDIEDSKLSAAIDSVGRYSLWPAGASRLI